LDANLSEKQQLDVVVLFRRTKTVEYNCALCGRRVAVACPPARILLLYGQTAAEAAPICPDCYDACAANSQERRRLWIKSLRR